MQYNKLLKSKPDASGEVSFRLNISKNGDIENCIAVTSQLSAPDFEKSICEIYKSLNYNKISEKPSEFVYKQQFLSI